MKEEKNLGPKIKLDHTVEEPDKVMKTDEKEDDGNS